MENKFCINKIVLSNPEEKEILWDSKQLDWQSEGELEVNLNHLKTISNKKKKRPKSQQRSFNKNALQLS